MLSRGTSATLPTGSERDLAALSTIFRHEWTAAYANALGRPPIMKLARALRPPIRFGWWLGAAAAGFAVPAAFTALIILGGYYPIGSWLPASGLLTPLGIFFAIGITAISALLAAAAYALLAWNWRPIALAVLFELCLLLGLAPAQMAGDLMLKLSFDALESRNPELIKAIEAYAHDKGTPPATLAQLVPDYLPAIPRTGIAVRPAYDYEPKPGLCGVGRDRPDDWNLSVSISSALIIHQVFYCPGSRTWNHEQSDGR